jgi:hypothetical protein
MAQTAARCSYGGSLTDLKPPPLPARSNLAIIIVLCALVVVLGALLFILVSISLNGLDVRVHGDVDLGQLSDQLTIHLVADEPFTLTMPQPVPLEATGPDGEAIAASLALVTCPVCGGPMLPSKWNPWTGQIVWSCPACGETLSQPAPQ